MKDSKTRNSLQRCLEVPMIRLASRSPPLRSRRPNSADRDASVFPPLTFCAVRQVKSPLPPSLCLPKHVTGADRKQDENQIQQKN